MNLIYTKEIQVAESHLDKNRHVNNVQYVHWVEDVAEEHWNILKTKTSFSEDFWVLIDHHIRYKKQVFLGDIVLIKTFPQSPKGIRQPRKVEFYCNGELVVESETLWILIDKETKKTKRVNENWLDEISEQS